MTREILFRGFHKDENGKETIYLNREEIKGIWVYGGFLNSYGVYYILPLNKKWGCLSVEVIKDTISQYTGIADKNGKKIFENDVVLINDDIANMFRIDTKGKVVYVNGAFKVADISGDDLLKLLYVLTDINGIFRGKIIGTIFDKKVK